MITAEKVKEIARNAGADLVGIAPVERFDGAPPEMDPRFINPEARSLIVVGFRIFRGCLRGIEEGTYFLSYASMGYAAINMIYTPMILWQLGRHLEDAGYEATPIPNNYYDWPAIKYATGEPKEGWSRPVSPGKPAPDVFLHFRLAAFCAGLGEIGYSKIFLTPEFGPRQRFACLLTEAPLEPDPLYAGPPLCDRCLKCVRACTGRAISATETVRLKVAGRQLEWGRLDVAACSRAFAGGNREYNPFNGEPSPVYDYGRALEGAHGCIRACMEHLEEKGRLKNTFERKFRRRPPWKMT